MPVQDRGEENTKRMPGPLEPRHRPSDLPEPFGLYDPSREHDARGVGFYANIHNEKSHRVLEQGSTS